MTVVRLVSGVLLLFAVSKAFASTWPQELESETGDLIRIFQPQIEALSGNSLEARTAISVETTSTSGPVFGAIWMVARLDSDRSNRTAVIRDIDVTEVRMADVSEAQIEALARFIEENVETSSMVIAIDQIVADLDGAEGQRPEVALNHEPPEIILSREPALLVMIDGEPTFQEIEGSSFERVVNTPFLIVRSGRDHFLYVGSNAWFDANDPLGPWQLTTRVPEDIAKLVEPSEDNADLSDTKIIVATEPTELVVTDGEPKWAPVEGMDLLYLENTDGNVFLELSSQRYYTLLSGRWYHSVEMLGQISWDHVPNDELPEAFRNIPTDSVNAAVRSQIAGTPEAQDAVLDNTIPQTAAIDREDDSFSVSYDGEPDFAPIEKIQVEYALNTAAAVFKYGSTYYACDDGVWYSSLSPTGGWQVATEVPDAIYEIPADNPHHNVTYVKVYDVTPEVVYVGYTPGYYGSYYSYGTVVYGTGWYYRPWYGPYYYPRYPTWGFHVHYNPWTGWNFGVSWTNGPFRFTFSTGGAWWGVGGFRPYPRPYVRGGYRKTDIDINIDNSINIGGGDRRQNRPSVYDKPENRARVAERTSTGSRTRPTTGTENNVLTDRAGNVYQRDNSGNWQQRQNGEWKQASDLDRKNQGASTRQTQPSTSNRSYGDRASSYQRPSTNHATRPQLERDYRARQSGAARANSYQHRAPARRR